MIGLRNEVSGARLAALASGDAQFRVPERPLLVRGVVFIECDLGVVVDGTDERQLFHGSGATTVLPELLPLLDGQNTMSEIAERLPSYPRSAVTDAVTLLYSRGLKEDGEDAEDPAWCASLPQLAPFFIAISMSRARIAEPVGPCAVRPALSAHDRRRAELCRGSGPVGTMRTAPGHHRIRPRGD